jgi:hypothetical protein
MDVYHVLPLFPTVIGPAGVDLSSRMVEKAAEREIYDALHCSDLVAFLRRQETASCDLLVATDVVMYLLLGSSGMKPFGVSCDVKWGAKYQPFLWYNCALLDALWAISAIKGNCSSSPVLRYLQVSIRMGYNTIILCGKIQCL